MEKPFGRDLASAQALSADVERIGAETGARISRVDHYLAKSGVLKMAAFRFLDRSFEPLWNNRSITRIEVKAHETIGVEGRGGFYDETGTLRDMVQGHLLQMLGLAIMHLPESLDGDAVRDSKAAALRSIKKLSAEEIGDRVVRGQYRAGSLGGKPLPGYLEEKGVAAGSTTETFVALKLESEDPSLAKVPIILSSGKAMKERRAEVAVTFGHGIGPKLALKYGVSPSAPARLSFWVEPEQKITLTVGDKTIEIPPPEGIEHFDKSYERVLLEAYEGDTTLFARQDEILANWETVTPILEATAGQKPIPYDPGTDGPAEFARLFEDPSPKKKAANEG
jgi:glucose-6-phosphate 1-dehydrogenase